MTSQEQLDRLAESWMCMINCISHDLMTPLATLQMVSNNLRKVLPDLLDAYQVAVQHNLIADPKFSDKNIRLLQENLIPSVTNSVSSMIEFLELLHPYNKKLLSNAAGATSTSIKTFLDAALKKYHFVNNQEQALVSIGHVYNFNFHVSLFFIEQLLEHLLYETINAINQANQGEIHIWTDEEINYNTLCFKLTAIGISQDTLTWLFSRFFSKRDGKIIPGLGFCRLALLQIGGDISYNSVSNEYTEFVIRFPKQC